MNRDDCKRKGCSGDRGLLDLSANENPLGASPAVVAAVVEALGRMHRYPDCQAGPLRSALAGLVGVPVEQIVLGNGASDLLDVVARTWLRAGDHAVIATPSFRPYRSVVERNHATVTAVPLSGFDHDLDAMRAAVTAKTRLIILGTPNNPTGGLIPTDDLRAFLDRLPPEVLVVLDEAYREYVDPSLAAPSVDWIFAGRPLVVLRSLSKAYGLAGLRIGYGIASPFLARRIDGSRQRFNTSVLAQAAALAAIGDENHLAATLRLNDEGRRLLAQGSRRLGLTVAPSQANFLLIEVGNGQAVADRLLDQGIKVKEMAAFGLPRFIRVSTGLAEDNRQFLAALETVMDTRNMRRDHPW